MFVLNCKSATRITSKMQLQLQELRLKLLKVMRKAKTAMALRTRLYLMTQIDLLQIISIMEVEERNNKMTKMIWRVQMMRKFNKSMMKKT